MEEEEKEKRGRRRLRKFRQDTYEFRVSDIPFEKNVSWGGTHIAKLYNVVCNYTKGFYFQRASESKEVSGDKRKYPHI
jgi:hypothetical protein